MEGRCQAERKSVRKKIGQRESVRQETEDGERQEEGVTRHGCLFFPSLPSQMTATVWSMDPGSISRMHFIFHRVFPTVGTWSKVDKKQQRPQRLAFSSSARWSHRWHPLAHPGPRSVRCMVCNPRDATPGCMKARRGCWPAAVGSRVD